jgi:catechol 2,3-dioxygenase-like lactoylglutathione lyase family enzyme
VEQRISIMTLGVADVTRARTFYERLGWHGQELEETVFFQAGSMALILWGRAKLAGDSGVADTGASAAAARGSALISPSAFLSSVSIAYRISAFSRKNVRAFSRPCPMRSPL